MAGNEVRAGRSDRQLARLSSASAFKFPHDPGKFWNGPDPQSKKFWNGPDSQSKKPISRLSPLDDRGGPSENARRPGGCPSRCVGFESSLIRLQFNIVSNSNRIRLKSFLPWAAATVRQRPAFALAAAYRVAFVRMCLSRGGESAFKPRPVRPYPAALARSPFGRYNPTRIPKRQPMALPAVLPNVGNSRVSADVR